MQENFIHLLSVVPCNLSVNGKDLGIIDNKNNFEVDLISKTDRIFLNYNPISFNQEYLPYSILLNTQKNLSCENSNVNIVPFPNFHTDVIFKPYKCNVLNTSKTIFSKNLNKYYVIITNNNDSQISIFDGANLLYSKNTTILSSARAELKKELLVIEGIVNENEYFLSIFDTAKSQIIFEDIVESIEIKENEIVALKNIKDISHHALVCKVDISAKSSQKYYVYENNNCGYALSPQLIPQDFLECVLVGDESKAKYCLHSNLCNATISKFQSYFGEIKAIYLNRHESNFGKLNYTILSDTYKNYNFIMENNKIKDIEEVF